MSQQMDTIDEQITSTLRDGKHVNFEELLTHTHCTKVVGKNSMITDRARAAS